MAVYTLTVKNKKTQEIYTEEIVDSAKEGYGFRIEGFIMSLPPEEQVVAIEHTSKGRKK